MDMNSKFVHLSCRERTTIPDSFPIEYCLPSKRRGPKKGSVRPKQGRLYPRVLSEIDHTAGQSNRRLK